MAIKLNKSAYEHAVEIIKNGLEVEPDTNRSWEEEKATDDEEIRYLNTHTLNEYGLWFLGVDTDADPEDRSKFVYPFGDFNVVHKSALLVAKKEAAKNGDKEIEEAARKLLEMVDRSLEQERQRNQKK